MQMSTLLATLVNRGDAVSIELGRLAISPASGKSVPAHWLQTHSPILLREILAALRIEAYEYISYTTGFYGRIKAPGVTLQFVSTVTGISVYTIFNADLTRDRTTKAGVKGTPLPKGHFRIGKRSHFYRFWHSTQLPLPKRLSSLHDYMGNLRGILFTADKTQGQQNRLDAGSLAPLSISAAEIRKVLQPDNSRTITGQSPDNHQTSMPDKDFTSAQQSRGLQGSSAACATNHGETVISTRDNTVTIFPTHVRKRPEEQTTEEWLADYRQPASQDENPCARLMPES
jgi:hypothetical protein